MKVGHTPKVELGPSTKMKYANTAPTAPQSQVSSTTMTSMKKLISASSTMASSQITPYSPDTCSIQSSSRNTVRTQPLTQSSQMKQTKLGHSHGYKQNKGTHPTSSSYSLAQRATQYKSKKKERDNGKKHNIRNRSASANRHHQTQHVISVLGEMNGKPHLRDTTSGTSSSAQSMSHNHHNTQYSQHNGLPINKHPSNHTHPSNQSSTDQFVVFNPNTSYSPIDNDPFQNTVGMYRYSESPL